MYENILLKSILIIFCKVLLSIIIGWIIAHILTVAGTMSDDPDSKERFARTDARFQIVHQSEWFTFPYPGNMFLSPLTWFILFVCLLLKAHWHNLGFLCLFIFP